MGKDIICNMKSHLFVLALAGVVLAGCGGATGKGRGSDVRNANEMRTGYSRAMINDRMSGWYNKDACVGFPNANSTNGVVQPETAATWDYVPGVVAKGILDVWSLYRDSAWADAWYEGLAQWVEGLNVESLEIRGGILDDLNCAKVYLGLYEGAKPGGKFENAERAAFYMEQMRLAAKGLEEHKEKYSLPNGGWMHKATDDPTKSYWGQMWCDGAYMGPALLAQLLAVGACEGTSLGWNDVYDQFYASWPYLWDEEKKLPYHVLFTDVTTNTNAKTIYEAGHAYECTVNGVQCTNVYHSEEYWGRAAGWYILALVDVLEAYLENVGIRDEGLGIRELPSAQNYVGEGGTQCNYLESSASCLITAALLKGSRLGLIDHLEAGKKGYEGILKQFVKEEENGILTITGSCQSAGLSKDRWGNAAYYLIGKDVPIQDNTEGKVLGAFLMAAAEYERL